MSVNLSPFAGAGAQFFTDAGTPLTGGLLYSYAAGTTTPATTYTSSDGLTANSNPIVLDSAGRVPYEIWLTAGVSYKFVLKTSVGTTVGTWDNIDGINDVSVGTSFYADVFTTTAGQTTFTLSDNPGSINNLTVSLDGAVLTAGQDFTWTGTTLVLSMAAFVGQTLRVAYSSAAGVKAISPGSVVDASVATGTKLYNRINDIVDVKDYGAVGNGIADDTAAIQAAIASIGTRGVLRLKGVFKVTSQIVLPTGVRLIGEGYSENNGTGAGNRGASCILRAFTDSSATVLASGDDCGVDLIDFDNNGQGTGECLQVTGSRFKGGSFSCRNSGGDGFRIGKTNAGASSTNSNAWHVDFVIVCGNAAAGMRVDDTNTTTSTSYPLGISNANAGYCGLVDARSNGTDGVQIGNANDNVFGMVVSQANTGCGLRFKTDGTNSGPRCNHILGNDCEANTGNDIQIDAATLPVSGPGLYNMVLGNRSVAINPRIVDNSTGSLVTQWTSGLGFRAYHNGSDVNALATSGAVGFNAYVGVNASPVRFYGVASGTVDGIARVSVHKNGGGQTDAFEVNQNAVFQPLNEQVTQAYSASITIDAQTGHLFDINANNGTAFTINAPTNPYTGQRMTLTIRNTSGGALGAVTWNAVFKLAAWTSPASGSSRSIEFKYNGANWVEISRTPADVPN